VTTLQNTSYSQRAVVPYQPFDDSFAPDAHFQEWLLAVESFRNREEATSLPGAYLDNGAVDFEDALTFYDHFENKISYEGTLVVTKQGQLQADVEVTVAIIDGVFKGKITATEGVVLENHALVIGDIYTPEISIRGGAIVEGKIHFDMRPQTSWERPTGSATVESKIHIDMRPQTSWERPSWGAFKVGVARAWRSRVLS